MEDYIDTFESEIDPDDSEKSDEGYPLKTCDPREIDISVEQQNIDFLLYKMEYDLDKLEVDDDFDPNAGIIDLNTEFQRSKDLWSQVQMSRLIESILIRFPLPAFYFDTTAKRKWQVIDGLQRLSTLRKFILDKEEPLLLKGLEFLDREKFENKTFEELPEPMQRTIRNTQVILILIRQGTPKEVKYRIFERVNTGGLKLTKQEIRHAINQGKPAQLLKKLSEIDSFKFLTRINSRRMDDRELCLRYLAFKFKSYVKYQPPMYHFLDSAMEEIGRMDNTKIEAVTKEFIIGLETANQILGKNAFTRQVFDDGSKSHKVNKAIFECLITCISNLSEEQQQKLIVEKDRFCHGYNEVLSNAKFVDSISIHTTDKQSITDRFNLINTLLNETIQ
jgi:hypothetical protein